MGTAFSKRTNRELGVMHEYGAAQSATPARYRPVGVAAAVGGRVRSALAALSALATLGSAIVALPSLMLDRFTDDTDEIWEPFLCDDEAQPTVSEGLDPMRGQSADGSTVG